MPISLIFSIFMVSKNKEMDNREIEKILASAEQLRLREKEPEPWIDNYSDMNSMEKSMLLDELFALRKADKQEREKLLEKLSRMTLVNWLDKGAAFTTKLVEALKAMAMEKDSIVNCDETWCKVKVRDAYYKKYIWCLVNKEQKTVIYCYEDGSRGRKALKEILADRKIKALQSDGYNVYMYLDNELVDTEHICCMVHARAKFVYAFEQSTDKDAKYIIDCIGELYGLEEQYKKGKLSPEQITQCRQSMKTMEIIGRIRSKLDALTADNHPPRGELMEKAVNYLKNFWKQLFNYLKDGRYSIDNSIAERFIRPLAGERKNSLFFGSSRMANVSAAYHTLLSTCRVNGISALDYLKKFFREIVNGRRDYENLLPMTIGINFNKL